MGLAALSCVGFPPLGHCFGLHGALARCRRFGQVRAISRHLYLRCLRAAVFSRFASFVDDGASRQALCFIFRGLNNCFRLCHRPISGSRSDLVGGRFFRTSQGLFNFRKSELSRHLFNFGPAVGAGAFHKKRRSFRPCFCRAAGFRHRGGAGHIQPRRLALGSRRLAGGCFFRKKTPYRRIRSPATAAGAGCSGPGRRALGGARVWRLAAWQGCLNVRPDNRQLCRKA